MAADDALSELLDAIEDEMRQIGLWDDAPSDLLARFESGELTSYDEAPSFSLWLQCVFLPRARKAVETGVFPPSSNVGVLAAEQYDGESPVEEALDLVDMLLEFDEAVNGRLDGGLTE